MFKGSVVGKIHLQTAVVRCYVWRNTSGQLKPFCIFSCSQAYLWSGVEWWPGALLRLLSLAFVLLATGAVPPALVSESSSHTFVTVRQEREMIFLRVVLGT